MTRFKLSYFMQRSNSLEKALMLGKRRRGEDRQQGGWTLLLWC